MRLLGGWMLARVLLGGVSHSAPARAYVTATAPRLPPDRLDALRALIAAERQRQVVPTSVSMRACRRPSCAR